MKMEFSRGDAAYHSFFLPADGWTAGGKLFFAAKPIIDDDTSDAKALIQGEWDDITGEVSDVMRGTVLYKKYKCTFLPAATESILSGGAGSAEYLGEFQFVPASGIPVTFPANDDKIPTILYFDVKRKTTV